MSKVKTKTIEPGYEPIEGYVLEKRIGRGGYGEVWRAEAPGGLKKALKFVYGQHDERRAAQELKSLERIKGIQHPFILTLERFELIENQLVIVTELADGSLEDIYKQHKKRGSCGIPREALLGYMQDAADALDYLHQLYKLQHLDIKPGNLLIVGGRVKVADFGLLKDLGDVECSLVGGLTPIYAPPEVFDGRPSMQSDQYSLAVMYQELLTSTRPFSGRTIAQLATQHVHNAPNLKPLPACDRPCVARALEKSPDRRFDSCADFVQRLVNPHGKPNQQIAPAEESVPLVQRTVENLPKLTSQTHDSQQKGQSHILVVGLGGTGADCLDELRARIQESGDESPIRMQSVLIDTNPNTIRSAKLAQGKDSAAPSHVVDACLRGPNEYRESGTERLKTISRRWIYNVPRTKTSGGMRPLGRLALVDHGNQVLDTLRKAVEDHRSSLTKDCKSRVYLVASLTGGTGSGMYLDVAYLLRNVLDEAALEHESVLSFLTTNRFQGDPSNPLAMHATKSAIGELAHFLKPGNGYPGDPGAGWPSVPAARTPLGDAYIVPQSDRQGAPDSLDSVVDYLWLDATVCHDIFASGRSEPEQTVIRPSVIRSLNVVQIGAPSDQQSNRLAPAAVKKLLMRWLGDPRSETGNAAEFAGRVIRRCNLNSDSLQEQTQRWFGHNDQDRRETLSDHLRSVDPAILKSDRQLQGELVKWLSQSIKPDQQEVVTEQIVEQVTREITLRVQAKRLTFSAVIAGIESIKQHLHRVAAELIAESDRLFSSVNQNSSDESHSNQSERKPLPRRRAAELRDACETGEQLINVVASRSAAAVASNIVERLTTVSDQYTEVSTRVAQCIQYLGTQFLTGQQDSNSDPWKNVEPSLRSQLPKLIDDLHDQQIGVQLPKLTTSTSTFSAETVFNELVDAAASLIRQIGSQSTAPLESGSKSRPLKGTDSHETVANEISSSSTVKVATYHSSTDSLSMAQTQSWHSQQESTGLTAANAVEAVRPPLLDCGGKQRLFLVCRDAAEKARIESQLPQNADLVVTTILAQTSMPMLVHEAQDIEVDNVLSWLDALTGDDGKISGRLATRCDIDWN